jgi:hypothetical protein
MGHSKDLSARRPAARTVASRAVRDTTEPTAGAPELLTPESVLALQRRAGNAAVTDLVHRGPPAVQRRKPGPKVVQRAPLPAADDPEGYTNAAGVADVRGTGLTRAEVHDLEVPGAKPGDRPTKLGVTGGFRDKYGKRDTPSFEKKMTKEASPAQMAVVIMPDKVDKDRPLQVIVQFHGFGFRQSDDAHDPYAGYLVASGKTGMKKGTVRDVDQEHWEQQISGVMSHRTAGQPQIVAILVQGRGNSSFGNVPTFTYVNTVLGRIGLGGRSYSMVLGAHSGGGFTLADKVASGGDADVADAAKLAKDPARGKSAGAADMVVMFDAEASDTLIGWVETEIAALHKALDADPGNAKKILAASPKFRAYFVSRDLKGAYAGAYRKAAIRLNKALDALPAQWRELKPHEVNVPDLFRIIEGVKRAGTTHEHIIGAVPDPTVDAKDKEAMKKELQIGALADSLSATTDPTVDRDKAYVPG